MVQLRSKSAATLGEFFARFGRGKCNLARAHKRVELASRKLPESPVLTADLFACCTLAKFIRPVKDAESTWHYLQAFLSSQQVFTLSACAEYSFLRLFFCIAGRLLALLLRVFFTKTSRRHEDENK